MAATDPFEINDLIFERFKNDFRQIIEKFKIKKGSILKSTNDMSVWITEPFGNHQIVKGDLMTIINIKEKPDEIIIYCLHNNRIFEMDAFVFFLSEKNNALNFTELFLHYFLVIF